MHSVTQTILVTGASSGIGKAISIDLLNQGHNVIGCSRDSSRFVTPHNNFIPLEIDFSDLNSVENKAKRLVKDHPQLGAIIFSSGYGQFGSLEEFSYAQIARLIDVNFTSQVYLTRTLLPQLKKNAAGHLIYIGSEAALKGSRKGTIYCASKFALRGFTQALREECNATGIRVSLINPGMVKTEFFDALNFKPGNHANNAISPDDIAQTVNYILNSNNNIVIDEINLNPANKVIQFKK